VEVPQSPRVIANRYRLESLIGEGGMASVWRAEDMTLERAVAVKLLYGRDERDRERMVRHFLREARIAASIQHRNVIHIVDFGTTEEEDQPYMVMELLDGESLGQRMARDPPLEIGEIVQMASLTLRGLAVVHEAGIVHRDLKPDNIFLCRDPAGGTYPKILDFGISRSIEPRSGRRAAMTTKEGVIVGTPEYMSPEQARGLKKLDRRIDIYSMGVILYEALTRQLPFESENIGDLIIQIVTCDAEPAHRVSPRVPLGLSDVVRKAMSRDPDDRYPDAPTMQRALLRAGEDTLANQLPRSLSDRPPPPPPAGFGAMGPERHSQDRLRTLEFPLDEPTDSAIRMPASPTLDAEALAMPDVLEAEASEFELGRGSSESDPPDETGLPIELVEPPASHHERSRRWPLLVAGLLVLSAAGLMWWGSASEAGVSAATEGATATMAAAAEPVAAAEPAAQGREIPPPPPQPTTSTVVLENLPEGAEVRVDNVPTPEQPMVLPRDGKNHVIKVLAAGKWPWQVVHHASGDASYEVLLVDRPITPAPAVSQSRRAAKRSGGAPKKREPKAPPSALKQLDF